MKWRNPSLAALLVLQVVLIAVLYWPSKEVSGDQSKALVSRKAAEIGAISITDDNQGDVSLKKDGEAWLIDPPKDFPGDAEGIGAIRDRLTGLESQRLVSRSRGSHVRLRVSAEKFDRKVVLSGKDSETTLYLGAAQGQQGLHVRLDGEDEVYFVTGLSIWELHAEASQWWKNSLVELAQEELTAISLKNGHGSFRFEQREEPVKEEPAAAEEKAEKKAEEKVEKKEPRKAWKQLEGPALDEAAILEIVRQASLIPVSEYLGADEPVKLEAAATTVEIEAGVRRITVEFDAAGKGKGEAGAGEEHLARLAGLKNLALVRQGAVDKLFGAGAPPEATEAAEAEAGGEVVLPPPFLGAPVEEAPAGQ